MSNKKKRQSGSPANQAAPSGFRTLRAALVAKTSLRTWHDISTAPAEEIQAAQVEVEQARHLVVATMLSTEDDVKARAKQALTEAEAKRAALFHRIWFKGLGTIEFDALVAMHPPTPAQAAKGLSWNSETFDYELLEHAAQEADGTPCGLTAQEWHEELHDATRWSRADAAAAIRAVLAAQRQTMADAVPKD